MVAFATRRSAVLVSLVLTPGSTPFAGDAQPGPKVPRVALLRPGSPPDLYVDALQQALRGLGYVEGQNITPEYRWAEGKLARLLPTMCPPTKFEPIVNARTARTLGLTIPPSVLGRADRVIP